MLGANPIQSPKGPRSGVRLSLKLGIFWLVLGLGFVFGLGFIKDQRLKELAKENLSTLSIQHAQFRNLFQASFYFFYKDQFLPKVQTRISETPGLKRVFFLSKQGHVLFDSEQPPKDSDEARDSSKVFPVKEIIENLSSRSPKVFFDNYDIQILMPAGQYSVFYSFDGSSIRTQIFLFFLMGIGIALTCLFIYQRVRSRKFIRSLGESANRIWGLRAKFLLTIVLINMITGAIVFFTLSELQRREEVARIKKESILFSRFSTDKVISDFSNFFYFYYRDKFLPAIREVVATNENLISIRIISNRTRALLFDSEGVSDGPVPTKSTDLEKVELGEEFEAALKARGLVSRLKQRDGEEILSVTTAYRGDNQDVLFLVEYLFSFQSLLRSIGLIRRQILIDLIPSMALGLIIATIFAQLLISPIRRLVAALKRVTEGDYDVSVQIGRGDEVGDLLQAFNQMTDELKKKKELRKFISDSTYRQVMEAPEVKGEARLKGTRLPATVLFSDIRNFVAHCESMDAEEITSMLNEYFAAMVDVVYKHGGEVDKFIGDAILAVFYGGEGSQTIRPLDSDTSLSPTSTSIRAIYCGLEMRERLKDFNRKRKENAKKDIEIGIGISHGEIISGPIGAKDRKDFTVIGDVVNLANRIEKLSKKGKHSRIVFSHHVEEKVRGLLDYEMLTVEKIRGKEEEVRVFELIKILDLEKLVSNMEKGDSELRIRSVELLGQSRNQKAVPILISLLDDDDEMIRLEAVNSLKVLSEEDDENVLDVLFRAVKSEKAEKVISAMIAAIGRICTTERILELREFLDSSNERIVANTIEAMGQGRFPKCTDLILKKLGSVNNRVKANAAMALFAAGHVSVIDSLKPMMMHSDPRMRSSAVFAIGELTMLARKDRLAEEWKRKGSEFRIILGELQECVPMLVALLRDPEPMVKRQAIIALGKIKDRSSVLPIIDNIDLDRDSKEMIQEIAQALREIGSHKLVREVLEKIS